MNNTDEPETCMAYLDKYFQQTPQFHMIKVALRENGTNKLSNKLIIIITPCPTNHKENCSNKLLSKLAVDCIVCAKSRHQLKKKRNYG